MHQGVRGINRIKRTSVAKSIIMCNKMFHVCFKRYCIRYIKKYQRVLAVSDFVIFASVPNLISIIKLLRFYFN